MDLASIVAESFSTARRCDLASGRLSPLRLGWTFLRIGTVAFGGLGATVALLERELVEHLGVMAKEEITESLTYTKLLPGSTVVQVVGYLGWRLGGWWASALATACFLLPSVVLMLALAYGYARVADVPALAAMRRGVLSAVVALLLLTMYRLAKPALRTSASIGLAFGAFVMVAWLHLGVVWVVIGAGLFGVAIAKGKRVDSL
jgi:chromate transporter